MATFSPVVIWVASFTFPNVPFPMVLPTLWWAIYLGRNCLISSTYWLRGVPSLPPASSYLFIIIYISEWSSNQIRTQSINELLEVDLPVVVLVTLLEDFIHLVRDVVGALPLDLVLLQNEVYLLLIHIPVPVFVDHVEHTPDILLRFYHLLTNCARNEFVIV